MKKKRGNDLNVDALVTCCFCGNVKIRTSPPTEEPRYECLECGAITQYSKPITSYNTEPTSIIRIKVIE